MKKVWQRDLVRHNSRDHDYVAGTKGFVQRVMRFGLTRSVIDNRPTPIVAWTADDYRTPVNLLDLGVVAISDLGRVTHDTQPRGRHEHYAIAGIAVKTENNLTMLFTFCRAQTDTVEPQRNGDFLHITSVSRSPCVEYKTQFP